MSGWIIAIVAIALAVALLPGLFATDAPRWPTYVVGAVVSIALALVFTVGVVLASDKGAVAQSAGLRLAGYYFAIVGWLFLVLCCVATLTRSGGDARYIAGPTLALVVLCALLPAFVVARRAMLAISTEGVSSLKTVLGEAGAPAGWLGFVPGSWIVFVDHGSLTTTQFTADRTLVGHIRDAARIDCRRQLVQMRKKSESFATEFLKNYSESDLKKSWNGIDQLVAELPTHRIGEWTDA